MSEPQLIWIDRENPETQDQLSYQATICRIKQMQLHYNHPICITIDKFISSNNTSCDITFNNKKTITLKKV